MDYFYPAEEPAHAALSGLVLHRPSYTDLVVLLSGVTEISLGLALLVLVRHKVRIGWVVAAFFICVFPGNIAQATEHRNAFHLDTDQARIIRLFFQPVLVAWAVWSTGAWQGVWQRFGTKWGSVATLRW